MIVHSGSVCMGLVRLAHTASGAWAVGQQAMHASRLNSSRRPQPLQMHDEDQYRSLSEMHVLQLQSQGTHGQVTQLGWRQQQQQHAVQPPLHVAQQMHAGQYAPQNCSLQNEHPLNQLHGIWQNRLHQQQQPQQQWQQLRGLHLAPPFLVEDYVPAAITSYRLGRMPAKIKAAEQVG